MVSIPKYNYSFNFMSHNFWDHKSTWISVSIPKYIYKCYCKYYYVENLLRAFRYCCLF